MAYKPTMYVYKIKHKTLQSPTVCWANIDGALEEIKFHLRDASEGDELEIKITKMSPEEFEKLPEFQGY